MRVNIKNAYLLANCYSSALLNELRLTLTTFHALEMLSGLFCFCSNYLIENSVEISWSYSVLKSNALCKAH